MILNDEQNDRFFDTMDALLYYVNDRFRVVESFTLDYDNPIGDVKSSLVAQALWDNVAIIDDFVRDNPARLSKRHLDLALSWKSALRGFYTLVRYQSGRALLMNEAGVFSVCGVTYELEQEIGPAPAYVETVLLPFDDLIVYDGFLQAYDTDRSSAEIQRIQDEFENRCAKGIAVTAVDFAKQADTYLAEQRDKELEALLADVASESARDGGEVLPEGFHRGVLAGLSPDERRAAVDKRVAELMPTVAPDAREFDRRVRKREPVTSLSGCLALMTKAELDSVAQVLGMGSLMRLRKAEMIAELVAEIPASPLPLEARLLIEPDADYAMARSLARGERFAFSADERALHALTWPIEPYVFMFRGKDGYEAVIPDELKPTFAAIDFDELDRTRRQRKQAYSCIEACVVLCGIASVDDVYDQYRALVADVLSRDDFDEMVQTELLLGGAAFDLWTYTPTDYLVHYTLSPDYVAMEYARTQQGSLGRLMRNQDTGELSSQSLERLVGKVRSGLRDELDWLENYKRDLVESQSNLPMKPLSRTILENDVVGELLDDENVVRLRSFLDAHVPDGADDCLFADQMVEQLVLTAIETGSAHEMMSYVIDAGIAGCTSDEERLPLLITNVYNAMPSWENNGWSPQELYEQLTGRRVFYNEDGSVKKVGADDACPCGSGKKYRDCCGK